MYYVYLLRCADGTLYTGFTNDLARRLGAHNAGRGQNIPADVVRWSWYTGKVSPTNPLPCAGSMPSSSSPGGRSSP